MCDVLPLKPCHIILGRPWIWDRDAHHPRRANTYSFVEGNKKYTLTCARDMPNLKLKKSSFLIRKIVPSNGILGPAPNSTESSYFQRGRIDGGVITWLKKGYSLWKPKAKAKPKNKCPRQLIKFLYFIWLFLSQGYFSNFTIVRNGPQLQAIGFINESYLIMGLYVWALV